MVSGCVGCLCRRWFSSTCCDVKIKIDHRWPEVASLRNFGCAKKVARWVMLASGEKFASKEIVENANPL